MLADNRYLLPVVKPAIASSCVEKGANRQVGTRLTPRFAVFMPKGLYAIAPFCSRFICAVLIHYELSNQTKAS
ncbi:MAG: hypothetical protein AB1861_24010 [Cyanobacteriota bacterium]